MRASKKVNPDWLVYVLIVKILSLKKCTFKIIMKYFILIINIIACSLYNLRCKNGLFWYGTIDMFRSTYENDHNMIDWIF